jgi:hypothetical protein
MMQWSITSILGILVLFLASNFLTLRKMRKDEIEKVQSEIIESINKNALPKIHSDLNNYTTSLTEGKLYSLSNELNALKSKVDLNNNLYKNDSIKMEADFHQLKGEFYETRHPSIAFTAYMEALELFMKSDFPELVPDVLDCLERCSSKMDLITFELTNFLEVSKDIKEEYEYQVNKIIDILKTKRRVHME